MPNVRLTPGQVLPGTVFASLALVLLTQVFPLYALYLGDTNPYGAIFGLFFLLMTWAYLVAGALLVGAELNALLRPAVPDRGAGHFRAPRDWTEKGSTDLRSPAGASKDETKRSNVRTIS